MILAIDPGNEYSAYAILNDVLKPVDFGKVTNAEMIEKLRTMKAAGWGKITNLAIEMVACYGMPVGKEVFETCVMIGKFCEIAGDLPIQYIYRKDEKINLCNSMKAKDCNIRQALIDRFGSVGVKKSPGWFYGVSKDVWSAIAVGVTFYDMYGSHHNAI
jgi:hypothetical protein